MKFKLLITAALLSLSLSASAAFSDTQPARIYMVLWRGCEEACQGFTQYLKDKKLPVELILRDAARDKGKLAGFLNEAHAIQPDLVVTWGTSVTKAIIGPIKEGSEQTLLGDIPAMFMVVADPISAGIVTSYEQSGRPSVTGIRNRVPEEVQIRAIQDYMDAKRIGVIYSPTELNSVLNTEQLEAMSDSLGFTLVKRTYAVDDKGNPLEGQLPELMKQMADERVDVIYVGSSSYNLQNGDVFTQAAADQHLPVASAYEEMVTKSQGLLAVANRYYNVGRLAANQAEKVLFDGKQPGALPISALSRYSVFINIDIARKLELFPPIQLLRFAELVGDRSVN
ncbi:peptide ABC transporter substrate-binding protein [Marinobacterium zhoushanense]|uniref:Peptide ABC transporter substrate-binding protein n=1 Tax=Marinobacterium zhoushanense TaxID=1679163 RepID=A0ABQ1K1Q7_9GAMM|nr:ABC transporter substrate-binding protein [Marinobacterium zhoushanense]GGB82504.1 peptide ABC transporter substrate-binding protein [Marinobacterium zhoushanense]